VCVCVCVCLCVCACACAWLCVRVCVQTSTCDRTEEAFYSSTLLSVRDTKDTATRETVDRENSDAAVLVALQRSMKQLQDQILEHFGTA
jgi:hypothetical protein